VVVYEVVSRLPPFESMSAVEVAKRVVLENLTVTPPERCPPLFSSIMGECCQYNLESRPSFEQLILLLEGNTDLEHNEEEPVETSSSYSSL